MRIDWTTGPAPGIAGRGRRHIAGFTVPDSTQPEAAQPEVAQPEVASATEVSPATLNQADALSPDAGRADREAAGHGQALLDALGDVQVAALDGDGGRALGRLADLAARGRTAADPALNEVLQAVAARAAVELARSE